MTEYQFASYSASIAISIWKISTNNGQDLARGDWDSHMQNCHAAVANAYTDHVTVVHWHDAALARVQ